MLLVVRNAVWSDNCSFKEIAVTHQLIVNNFQIDLFIKLMQNHKTTKFNQQEKEEIDILIDCLNSIKQDSNSENVNDLTEY